MNLVKDPYPATLKQNEKRSTRTVNGKEPDYRQQRQADDLGPSGFNPYAPYKPVEPHVDHPITGPNNNQEENLVLLAHLLGLLGVFGFVGPLIIWLTQKDKSPYVEEQSREALNFQLTVLISMVVCSAIAVGTCGLMWPLIFVPITLQIVFGIIATLAVSNGTAYRYPFNLRLIK